MKRIRIFKILIPLQLFGAITLLLGPMGILLVSSSFAQHLPEFLFLDESILGELGIWGGALLIVAAPAVLAGFSMFIGAVRRWLRPPNLRCELIPCIAEITSILLLLASTASLTSLSCLLMAGVTIFRMAVIHNPAMRWGSKFNAALAGGSVVVVNATALAGLLQSVAFNTPSSQLIIIITTAVSFRVYVNSGAMIMLIRNE